MAYKKSFFERLTGGIRLRDEDEEETVPAATPTTSQPYKITTSEAGKSKDSGWTEDEAEEAQLTVDVYQTQTEIIVQTMVAGVRPEDLQINITRDMITIKGKREENKMIAPENYFTKELYWGTFARTILLPQEVEPEEAEAIERHGLLMIRLPKIDKGRQTTLKVKSI